MGLTIKPLAGALGAEILGIDLSRPLADADWAAIEAAFHRHFVIFFRDQHLTPDQQIAFARRFGLLEDYPYIAGLPDHPELIEVVKLPSEDFNFGSGWHADMSYRDAPPLGAVLYAMEMPPVGGDTMFASLHAAYDALSEGLRQALAPLHLLHDSGTGGAKRYAGMQHRRRNTGQLTGVHPLVRQHPVTGRPLLALSPFYAKEIEDMTGAESRALLEGLEDIALRPEHCCRFHWEVGSLAVWDNRCLLHNALNDDFDARMKGRGFRRVMRRATIASA